MSTHSVSLSAIRTLILVRKNDPKPLTGNAIISQLRDLSGNSGQATGMLSLGTSPIETIYRALDLLVQSGLLQATDASSSWKALSYDSYKALRAKGSIQAMKFTITSNVNLIQETLGLLSLTELEQRAMGNTMSIQPVFGQVQTGLHRSTFFVAMPFDEDLKPVFDISIAPAVREVGQMLGHSLIARRADNIFSGHTIMNKVWSAIFGCYAVIVDCTGRNANVFYELGMAHTVGKTCIIIAQSRDDIPFDITQFEYLTYDNTPRGLADLKNKLSIKIEAMVKETPPL